jgi:hypothetical protein
MNIRPLLSPVRVVAVVFLLGLAAASNVFAGNITVTNLNDSGDGSLRAAIQKANAQKSDPKKGPPVIQFAKNLSGTINLTSGVLVITGDVIVNGPGANVITVNNAAANASVFQITFGNVNISGLTISGGNNTAGGGGFLNSGALTLNDVMVVNNSGGSGAGILNNAGGTLEVTNSTIANNTSTGLGGGVHNAGTTTINNSTVSTNQALNGGGVYSEFGSTLTVTQATVAFNSASSNGGGLYNEAQVSTTIGNTIVAKNTSAGTEMASGADVYAATLTSTSGALITNDQGNNLIGNTDGASGYAASDKTGNSATPLDPKLGPLTQNGGTTTTHAELSGSPAIDSGNNSLAEDPSGALLAFDQRGSGFPRISNNVVDIGAFEVQIPTAPQSARQWKTDAVNLLSASIPTGDAKTDKIFQDAIKDIQQSLDPKLWVDDSHLVGKGDKVFDPEEDASKDLESDDIAAGGSQSIAQQANDDLVMADSLLATTEYNSALACDGSEEQKAQQYLLQAQQDTKDSDKVEDYEQAFQHAYKACHH